MKRSPASLAAARRKLAVWFAAHGRDLPWRRTRDPYAILVSELMLQQTQVATVIPYFERWMARFPTFQALAAAEESDVLHAWQGLGYYARARNLHRAAQQVAAQHGDTLPPDLAAIARLPGVGRYTAGAIASFAFDLPAAAVDANIARVLARMFDMREPIDSTRGAALLWAHAEEFLPRNHGESRRLESLPLQGGRLHTSALMELGALVCLPRAPHCLACPVRSDCRTRDPESLPSKKPRRKTVALEEHCAWILDNGCLLLEQQTGPRWRGMWKLPRLASGPPAGTQPLVELTYPFTHHRVTLRVFAADPPTALLPGQQWAALSAIDALPFPSPHRRALITLGARDEA